MHRSPLLYSIIILLSIKTAKAQNREIGGAFPTIDHSGTFNNKWSYSLYYFGAFSLINPEIAGVKDEPHLNAFYSEQTLSFNVNKEWSFTGSYVYERQNAFRTTYRNENRFYIQTTYKYNLNLTNVKHRLRYDGRYIENRVTKETPYTNRLRYLIGLSTPFKKESDKVYFTAYNEFFFDLDKSSTAIYSENWAFAGFGFKTKSIGKFEIGPLYIFWVANKSNDLINFYYLQLTWVTHLNFKKDKG